MFIGIDDTDSADGMCTTYLGALLIRNLEKEGADVRRAFLIRLNPTVPYKTRGNAAVCIEAYGDCDRIFATTCDLVEQYAEFSCEKTNPGVVIAMERGPVFWYERCVREYVTIQEALSLITGRGMIYRGWKNCRGLIGASAAVSADLSDSTWEVIAYREEERLKTPRQIDAVSIFSADAATRPHTWDSVDHKNHVVVCVPHTPDPVLYGIRGESPFFVSQAAGSILSEPIGISQLWCTNQGTDSHLIPGNIGHLIEGSSYFLTGTVTSPPHTGRGGHVTFSITGKQDAGSDKEDTITCIAYEPTKGFRDAVRALISGDLICVAGSYLRGSINLEKFQLIVPARHQVLEAPECPACLRLMTSAGTNKGYKCRRCGCRRNDPVIKEMERHISPGWYEVPPIARRHLSRPLIRDLRD